MLHAVLILTTMQVRLRSYVRCCSKCVTALAKALNLRAIEYYRARPIGELRPGNTRGCIIIPRGCFHPMLLLNGTDRFDCGSSEKEVIVITQTIEKNMP